MLDWGVFDDDHEHRPLLIAIANPHPDGPINREDDLNS